MNREIKFRAWNNESKEMHYWTLNDLLCRFGEKDYANDNTASPFFNWMQYTGLKDKNDVEIYEGDIMHDPDGDYIWSIVWAIYTNKADLDLDLFIVGWIRKCIDGTLSPLGYYRGVEGNVIGNIHENPELLKQ